ncbi:hypothetical protein K450DRAFT_228711 [Umbelopsis ramanniana AG]|uniref:Uncharacterized protein n=1 Tax=Umbelopsis ramanniana AG TaxID=1314678 RepID=A0AAD5EDS1_UMBRA|nr:uncharacterized protein K450DRAFT_228711 [Umbelopsis ramanniana AG]KAI8582028.1 hypothetical protein K450DRAFT_228711 [Umbelopsis ramanniana AG]
MGGSGSVTHFLTLTVNLTIIVNVDAYHIIQLTSLWQLLRVHQYWHFLLPESGFAWR